MSQAGGNSSGGTIGPTIPTQFTTDAGVAIPAANNLNVLGTGGTSTSGAGSTITITSVQAAYNFTDIAISTAGVANRGYFCTAALTLTLPTSPPQGSFVFVETLTASAVVVKAGGTNLIKVGSATSSAGGTATATTIGNSLQLFYRTADTTWYSLSTEGTWSIA